jgi:hypothetical protein
VLSPPINLKHDVSAGMAGTDQTLRLLASGARRADESTKRIVKTMETEE